jgi:hypothetical protein
VGCWEKCDPQQFSRTRKKGQSHQNKTKQNSIKVLSRQINTLINYKDLTVMVIGIGRWGPARG